MAVACPSWPQRHRAVGPLECGCPTPRWYLPGQLCHCGFTRPLGSCPAVSLARTCVARSNHAAAFMCCERHGLLSHLSRVVRHPARWNPAAGRSGPLDARGERYEPPALRGGRTAGRNRAVGGPAGWNLVARFGTDGEIVLGRTTAVAGHRLHWLSIGSALAALGPSRAGPPLYDTTERRPPPFCFWRHQSHTLMPLPSKRRSHSAHSSHFARAIGSAVHVLPCAQPSPLPRTRA